MIQFIYIKLKEFFCGFIGHDYKWSTRAYIDFAVCKKCGKFITK
jgi:hypothetical protein